VDLRLHGRTADRAPGGSTPWSVLSTALVGLKNSDPRPPETIPVTRRALVVGGGIAGMTAALSIAEQGYPVDLVEQQDHLGGNLTWLGGTIEGLDLQTLLADTLSKVAGHPQIEVHLNSAVIGAYGQVGRFFTTVETKDAPPRNIEHGIVVLATGGGEAPTRSFSHGAHPGIITQKKLEADLGSGALDPDKLRSVAMLMCVDSRREPRNYCSRICCPTAIKQALAIKQMRPETAVTILYRDIMTCGFCETYFTQARRAGIIFIAYSPEDPRSFRKMATNWLSPPMNQCSIDRWKSMWIGSFWPPASSRHFPKRWPTPTGRKPQRMDSSNLPTSNGGPWMP
jgi:heterodisulfide reductase subunit A